MEGDVLTVHIQFHQNGCSSCIKFLWVKWRCLVRMLQVAMRPYQEVEMLFVPDIYSKQKVVMNENRVGLLNTHQFSVEESRGHQVILADIQLIGFV